MAIALIEVYAGLNLSSDRIHTVKVKYGTKFEEFSFLRSYLLKWLGLYFISGRFSGTR